MLFQLSYLSLHLGSNVGAECCADVRNTGTDIHNVDIFATVANILDGVLEFGLDRGELFLLQFLHGGGVVLLGLLVRAWTMGLMK